MLPDSIPQDEDKLAHYRGSMTIARFAIALQLDPRIRDTWEDGIYYMSVVDMMGIWGEPEATRRRSKIQDPREWWKQEKRRLAKNGCDAVERLHRISLPDKIGRMQKVDMVTLETAIELLLEIDTKATREFRRFIAKGIASIGLPEWEYRKHFAMIEAQGSANSIDKFLREIGASYFDGKDEGRLD